MKTKECLYLDKTDIPVNLYEDLYDLASFRGEFCESFFVRLDYIDSYIQDMKNDNNDDLNKISFYEKLSKDLHDAGYDLLFICNDESLKVFESSYDYNKMVYERDTPSQCKFVSRGDKKFEIIEGEMGEDEVK